MLVNNLSIHCLLQAKVDPLCLSLARHCEKPSEAHRPPVSRGPPVDWRPKAGPPAAAVLFSTDDPGVIKVKHREMTNHQEEVGHTRANIMKDLRQTAHRLKGCHVQPHSLEDAREVAPRRAMQRSSQEASANLIWKGPRRDMLPQHANHSENPSPPTRSQTAEGKNHLTERAASIPCGADVEHYRLMPKEWRPRGSRIAPFEFSETTHQLIGFLHAFRWDLQLMEHKRTELNHYLGRDPAFCHEDYKWARSETFESHKGAGAPRPWKTVYEHDSTTMATQPFSAAWKHHCPFPS